MWGDSQKHKISTLRNVDEDLDDFFKTDQNRKFFFFLPSERLPLSPNQYWLQTLSESKNIILMIALAYLRWNNLIVSVLSFIYKW